MDGTFFREGKASSKQLCAIASLMRMFLFRKPYLIELLQAAATLADIVVFAPPERSPVLFLLHSAFSAQREVRKRTGESGGDALLPLALQVFQIHDESALGIRHRVAAATSSVASLNVCGKKTKRHFVAVSRSRTAFSAAARETQQNSGFGGYSRSPSSQKGRGTFFR